MIKIPCMLYRGGTSKGPLFLKSNLPTNPKKRDKILLNVMGSPHVRQIDGIGGGDSLSSKVAIVSTSKRKEIDIDYLLCQVHINDEIVETSLNCGNMLAAVAPFAIENGLVQTTHPETCVKIFNENTNVIVHVNVQTPQGKLTYEGNTAIDGVSGTSAPIKLNFLNAGGSKTGKLFPTGNKMDEINGTKVTCIDVAVPMVIVAASSLHKTGYESKLELDKDKKFLKRLERLRQRAATKMGLGRVRKSICPKICMIAKPKHNGTISSRYFTPFDCHATHAVSGALCLSAASLIKGTIANKLANIELPNLNQFEKDITIEHPRGKIQTNISIEIKNNEITFPRAAFIRTARLLFEGNVYAAL